MWLFKRLVYKGLNRELFARSRDKSAKIYPMLCLCCIGVTRT
jgi:hypothetical protein